MSATLMLARAGWRRRRGPLLGLGLVLALGTGVAITAFEAAARTDKAYPSYLRRAQVGELVVNPGLTTDRVEGIIASTPGVVGYVSDSMLTATADDGHPRTQVELDAGGAQVRVSVDGRYVDQDRPVVHEGRMIHDGAEAFVNVEMADAFALHVGDTLPLAFWGTSVNDADVAEGSGVVEPFGRSEARVVGIGVFSDEVLVDGLYPRVRAVVTPEVGAAFDCTPVQPGADDPRSLAELVPVLLPANCARSYRYYSLRVEGGDGGVGPVTDALSARFIEASEQLPAALRANNIGFEIIPTVTADERQRVQQSLAPAVRALQLFGVAAATSTLVLVLLGAVRIARREEHDARIWRDLGAGRALRAAGVGMPLAVAALAGLAGSLVVGWLASGVGPVASARSVDPAGRLGLSAGVVLAVVGGSALVLAVGILFAAGRAARSRPASTADAPSRPSRILARSANPSLTLGIRATTAASGGRALVGASIAAVTAVLATVVFSSSLSGLVDRPERFGWPFDVAATINYGYGETTDQEAITATLDRPEVEGWGLASLAGGLIINGETMPYVAAGPGFDAIPLPVVEGQLPAADDEIALGSQTADRLGLGVGSTVMVNTAYGEREATVRGLVVLPPVGPFLADRTSLGTGALLSARFHEAILRDAERAFGMEPGQLVDTLGGFVAIDLREGVDPERFLADISAELPTWDTNGVPPFVYAEPVRPATVANVAAMQAVPVALAGLLALTMALGLMLAIAVATRGRSRELAVLRALGCVGRQLRSTVRWQALTVVVVGLVVGIPLGLASGRIAYRAFATGVGVLPDPVVPLPLVLALVVATIGMGLLAAAAPGHRAARITAGEALRHE